MVDLAVPAKENSMRTKVDTVIDDITRKIRSGAWPPGYQLPPDRELRQEYDCSQMTIRTAMERLHALVVSVPGKGRFVVDALPPG